MKIHVMSDIHFEHMRKEDGEVFAQRHGYLCAASPADVLILAGDICQMYRHEFFWKPRLEELVAPYKLAVYVPGNHEYYHSNFDKVDKFIKDAGVAKLHNLNDGPIEFNGQRFIGGTMWFPPSTYGNKAHMSDFYEIENFEPGVYDRHRNFLTDTMTKLKNTDIVVTHHLPLTQSIDLKYAGSTCNPFFLANIEPYLNEGNLPRVWLHGHTHSPCDYTHTIGQSSMRVYCNPLGYTKESGSATFWSRAAIDL